MIDMELLEKMENHLDAYMTNSPHNVKKFLKLWRFEAREALAEAETVKGIDWYKVDLNNKLSRINRLLERIGEA